MDANEIIQFISNSKKSTPVKVYVKGNLDKLPEQDGIKAFVDAKSGTLFGEWKAIEAFLKENESIIEDYVIENDRRNSAIPMLDLKISMHVSSRAQLFVTR